MNNQNEIFGRINSDGNVDVLFSNTGENVTRLDVDNIYPVNSSLSTHYEHPEGITLTLADAKKINLEIE